jgi:anaerobic selenocysteine-containing dehydrogenase
LRAALDGFDLSSAAAIAGVPESDLTDLLAAVRARGRVVVETGTGVTMADSGNVTHWLSWVLMALTGTMNRPGGIWFHPGFFTCFDSFELPVFENPLTPGPPTMPGVSGIIGDWPCGSLPGEIAAGNIRAVVNFGGSLIRSFPDANVLGPALQALDVCATFEIVANETTALSTHVLPTKDQLERPEVSMWDSLASRVSVQHAPALVPATGQRRSAWWVISQVMQRLGMDVPEGVPGDDRAPGADEAMLARHFGPGARCTYDEAAAAGYLERPLEFPARWVDEHIERIGGWNLAPKPLLEQWHALRSADEAALDTPRPLAFISRRQRRKLNASLDFLGAPADVILHPVDAAAHGIAEGQRVRVSTPRGEIALTACIDDAMRPGVASIPHGHGSANVNLLTDTECVDPLGGMALYTGIPIAVEPIEA